jgi:hypothetical protein
MAFAESLRNQVGSPERVLGVASAIMAAGPIVSAEQALTLAMLISQLCEQLGRERTLEVLGE